ncbi:fibropellin-3-like isoform X2 [Rhopilema esculentum]|uniref:fibropellin-3-like isoform X2 n=1 Tax=Rhopilema esculentum TaxID=499914 RepID=UPI0031E2786B
MKMSLKNTSLLCLVILQSTFLPLVCRLLRLPCKMIAEFKIVHRGYWLQGSVIAEFTEAGLQDCYGYCLHNPRCKSFNIEKDDYGTCQLNSMSSHDVLDNKTLTANGNWNFHSTNFSEKMVGHNCKMKNPCRGDEICLDTCSCPGYECLNCAGNLKNIHCNRCASHPCQNGGTCNEMSTTLCSCIDGFIGPFCENIDECSSNPCNNGGTCNDRVNGYACTCAPGYTGIQCETNIDECLSNPCINRGTCNDRVNGYACTCAPGYTGIHCETGACLQYAELSDPSRSINHIVNYGDQLRCDNNLVTSQWYRFTGEAGTTMHTSCPEYFGTVFRCSTHAGGWLNGQHPTIQEGEVARDVCFAWNGNCCNWVYSIKVINCGNYFIYQLRPTSCSYRYCGSG